MKKVLLCGFLVIGFMVKALACDIRFSVSGNKKEVYKTGDEVVIEVTVHLIHRSCALEIAQTKFTYEGIKILGATEWKEVQPGTYVRQVKTKVLDDGKTEAKLIVNRKCSREGGYGVVSLKKQKA